MGNPRAVDPLDHPEPGGQTGGRGHARRRVDRGDADQRTAGFDPVEGRPLQPSGPMLAGFGLGTPSTAAQPPGGAGLESRAWRTGCPPPAVQRLLFSSLQT